MDGEVFFGVVDAGAGAGADEDFTNVGRTEHLRDKSKSVSMI